MPGRSIYDHQMDPDQEDALKHLASVDLIELCNEAKIEHCRATRDLSSCRRDVHHVLVSCGHASLCTECSQRVDVCPICRTSLPKTGNRIRLRLYDKCVEAGLIPKNYSGSFQENKDNSAHLMNDIQRLYALFDAALGNNLVSLICHYVTDVCMDESAVSSDPVIAFLLDEVVVKDWCKRAFKSIIYELQLIYNLAEEAMMSKLPVIQKLSVQLSGISNVLDVMDSSFRDAFSAQLHDLHELLEDTHKVKQHLDVMSWCIQHQFLKDIPTRHDNHDSWNLTVRERKSAAVKRSWPEWGSKQSETCSLSKSKLFIEEALENLGIEDSYIHRSKDGMDILCLQDNSSPILFQSTVFSLDRNAKEGCYPFENLRAAVDVLFLHGTSDTVVAKRAIFLYYLFDRYWTKPDLEWRYVIDSFAACFSIARNAVLESLSFYLLDDHTDEALQEASCLLPQIAAPETHPRIAQVLLERHCPDTALNVLRCSGRDCPYAFASSADGSLQHISIGEAVTAVRVRIECGLLTEAFMYLRMHCFKYKEEIAKTRISFTSDNLEVDSWISHVEILVTEVCYLCIRRNLVDRMIELPWNSPEEKYIHKCLFDHACLEPSSTVGSLLVVYYLQRYRYGEAYQVDRNLRNLEESFMEAADEETVLRIRSITNWRSELVDKCLQLLPDAEREKVVSGLIPNIDDLHFSDHGVPPEVVLPTRPSTNTPFSLPSVMLQRSISSSIPRKDIPQANNKANSPISSTSLVSRNSTLSMNRKLHTSLREPSRMKSPGAGATSSSILFNGGDSSPSGGFIRNPSNQGNIRQKFQEEVAANLSSRTWNHYQSQGKYDYPELELDDEMSQMENYFTSASELASQDQDVQWHSNANYGIVRKSSKSMSQSLTEKQNQEDQSLINVYTGETKIDSSGSCNGSEPVHYTNMHAGQRWRTDE